LAVLFACCREFVVPKPEERGPVIARGSWERRLGADGRRVLVLDDDPTGTQTVSDVEVMLRPSLPHYRRFFAGRDRAAYVLTNSRALPVEEAVALVLRIKAEAELAAAESAQEVAFVLRGDSTLRGHVFAEMDVFATEDSVGLFVPAFPEGGRTTVDGVHYLDSGDGRVPVARTEFARDTIFGYRSERLVDWVAEVGGGRGAVSVPLEELRRRGPEAVAQALLEASPGTVVLPDAETREDVEAIASGLLDAEEGGRRVVVRSGSTFAAIRAGLGAAEVWSVGLGARARVLVVCGSHTAAGSRQLEGLVSRTHDPVVVPTGELLDGGPGAIVPGLVRRLAHDLESNRLAILATERIRRPEHGDLAAGARVMAAVTAAVAGVADRCDAVISKGGITSAQVATDGLSALSARVRGQLEPGVSLWDLSLTDGRRLPYAVIPGNVGHDDTLLDVAAKFGVEARGTPRFQGWTIKPESPVAEITNKLMDYLLSGKIRPGERLPAERQLSQALGVGRSALREALKALNVLGLVDVRRGDGTYLKEADSPLLPQVIEWGLLLGEKRTMDLMEARQELEVILARLAAERRDEVTARKLRRLLERMKRAGTDYREFVEADVAFHLTLAEAAGNAILRDILSSIQSLLRTWITTVLRSAGNTGISYEEHVPIFEAVERGDPEAASIAMTEHMNGAATRLKKALTSAENVSGSSQGLTTRRTVAGER
jgi:DNA-binding FadR family transcriptional regulator/uncharacterized protein YgbK (DUF1537 family)